MPIVLDHPLAEPLFLSLLQFHWLLIPQIVPPPLQFRKIEIRGTKHLLLDVAEDVEDALQPTTAAAALARNTLGACEYSAPSSRLHNSAYRK